MRPLDWIIVVVYLGWVVIDGLRRARGTDKLEGYFLAKRSIPWWAAGLSVMATQLFGDSFTDWFGSLGASMYTLFQIMTVEGWPDIAREVIACHHERWDGSGDPPGGARPAPRGGCHALTTPAGPGPPRPVLLQTPRASAVITCAVGVPPLQSPTTATRAWTWCVT